MKFSEYRLNISIVKDFPLSIDGSTKFSFSIDPIFEKLLWLVCWKFYKHKSMFLS